jgi:hypothetical protein
VSKHGSIHDAGGELGAAENCGALGAAESRGKRRPYLAPAIEETSDFETLALACAGSPVLCDPEDPVEPQEPSS